jgi:hypothetical protein
MQPNALLIRQNFIIVKRWVLHYYRRFIPNFSKIAKPIIDLLEKDEKYV